MMNLYSFLLVGVGGFFGSIARYATSRSIDIKLNSIFPYGTMTVNIIGSFILGVVIAWASKKTDGAENLRLLFATGFCGGFTTFSAFAFENLNMLQQRMFGTAVLYALISLVLGIVAVYTGIFTAKNLL
jgi:fluoride exporter